jgi:hypothetical protein
MLDAAELPPPTDQCWKDILAGRISKPWNQLALEIMLAHLSLSAKNDPSPQNIDRCAREVRDYFQKNQMASPQEFVPAPTPVENAGLAPRQSLGTAAEVSDLIRKGRSLLLAGEEELLSALPLGSWIGGTSSILMTESGESKDNQHIFYTDVTDHASSVDVRTYTASELHDIAGYYPGNGYTVLIVPGLSEIHGSFAREVYNYTGVFGVPLAGWVSGVPVEEIGKRTPKVFAGSKVPQTNIAVAMHVTLPKGYFAQANIINLFRQGSGPVIEFLEDGFSTAGPCLIDGKKSSLIDYITANKTDMRLPLIADYNGTMINVSLRSTDEAKGIVRFYAPVFRKTSYRLAEPLTEYAAQFAQALEGRNLGSVVFSCNCLLNYLHAGLAGKTVEGMVGPITFGEIVYVLLNRTFVYLSIMKAA